MKPFDRKGRRGRTRARRRGIELALERCEDRFMLSIMVTNLHTSGTGSLADAIGQANQAPNSTIVFTVTGVINEMVAGDLLPALTAPTTIMGTSVPGATPVIEINGNGLTGNGLILGQNSNGSTIEGLSIVNFS